jgi:class 3 adenylate cyclase
MSHAERSEERESRRSRRGWRLPLSAYLGFGFGGLVLVALGLILIVTLSAVFKNTTELLQDKSRLLLGALSAQTSRYLEATRAPCDVIAQQIATGELSIEDADRLGSLLGTLLAATPQIQGITYIDAGGRQSVAFRENGGIVAREQSWRAEEDLVAAMVEALGRRTAYWGPPVFNEPVGTFLNLRLPVHRDGRFLGLVAAIVDIRSLATFVASLETEIGQNAFILYGRDRVLAHRALAWMSMAFSAEMPLPPVDAIGDPVLSGIWQAGWEENALIAGSGHYGEVAGREYVFLYQPLEGYADLPWLIGSYFEIDSIGSQVERMAQAGIAALAVLLASLLATYVFGRVLRRPVDQLAAAARRVQALEFERVPPLPRSSIAELDDAGRAFNAMLQTLRSFARYVPRDLVRRLMARGDLDALPSEARTVTVLMTDISGFSSFAERADATATAEFLNRHFSLVTRCIEAEGGTIDKYIGDAVMALWGALDEQSDQTEHAVRAALRIARDLRADNAENGHCVRLRIDIHRGPVIAGNIGTTARMNYTVVGDTVNLTQRLEALAKTLLPDAETAILMSADAARRVSPALGPTSLGAHRLPGLMRAMEVFTVESRPA